MIGYRRCLMILFVSSLAIAAHTPVSAQISLPWRDAVWNDTFTASIPPARYTLVGSCSHDAAAGNLVLTPNISGQAGAVYLPKRYSSEFFDVTFSMYLGVRSPAVNGGADGIVFAMARTSNYPASFGGELNFNGSGGLGIEFDTYYNPTENDLSEEHVGLIQTASSNHLRAVALAPGTLKNGAWHTGRISFAQGAMRVFLDGAEVLTHSITGFSPYDALYGFTAASGVSFNEHRVDNVTLSVPSRRVDSLGVFSACEMTTINTLVRIRNNHPSGAPLTLTRLMLTELDRSGEFSVPIDPLPLLVASGDSVSIPIRFTGIGAGLRRAVLEVFSSIGESVQDTILVQLTEPQAAFSPSTLGFDAVQVGASKDAALTVRNISPVPMRVQSIVITHADFSLLPPGPPFILAPGESRVLNIRFAPKGSGPVSGRLELVDACGTIFTMQISGEGVITPWAVHLGEGLPGHIITPLMLRPDSGGTMSAYLSTDPADIDARGLDAVLLYDTGIARFVGARLDASIWDASTSITASESTPGAIALSIRSQTAISDLGRLFTLDFTTTRNDTGCTTVEWDTLVWNPQGPSPGVPPSTLLDGRICVNNSCRTPYGLRSLMPFDMANRPNPFNPSTTIRFNIPLETPVRLSVYDALGRELAALVDRILPAGEHIAVFTAADLPSGLYIAVLTTPDGTLTHPMLLLR